MIDQIRLNVFYFCQVRKNKCNFLYRRFTHAFFILISSSSEKKLTYVVYKWINQDKFQSKFDDVSFAFDSHGFDHKSFEKYSTL